MKKILFMAAIVIAAMSSCSQSELMEVTTDNSIEFGPSVAKNVVGRAPISGTEYPTGTPFGVFAYYLESGDWVDNTASLTPFMDNVKITYQTNAWKAADKYYWPSKGTLTFVGYSPYMDNSSSSKASYTKEDGITFTDFEVVATPADQIDLMYTTPEADKIKDDGAISLSFNHALAQVAFKAAKTGADYTITIKEIKVTGVKSKGTFKAAAADNKWTFNNPADTTSFTYYKNVGGQKIDNTADSGELGDALLMIPQTFSSDANIFVTYDIAPADGKTGVKSETNLIAGYSLNDKTWTANQKITYVISISMDEVSFMPTVTSWTDPSTEETLTK